MDIKGIEEVSRETAEGKLTFPDVIHRLQELGAESYFVDLAAARKLTYASSGAPHSETLAHELSPVAADFSAEKLIEAIRAAQADTIRHPEFLRQAAAAGVIAYWVFLTGKRVLYFGRKGEFHMEEFPRPNPAT